MRFIKCPRMKEKHVWTFWGDEEQCIWEIIEYRWVGVCVWGVGGEDVEPAEPGESG